MRCALDASEILGTHGLLPIPAEEWSSFSAEVHVPPGYHCHEGVVISSRTREQ